MRVKITDADYTVLVALLEHCLEVNFDKSYSCYLLLEKLRKAKAYSESNKTARGIVRCKECSKDEISKTEGS